MLFTPKTWKEFGAGFEVIDCALYDRGSLFFSLSEITRRDTDAPQRRLLEVRSDASTLERFRCTQFSAFDLSHIAYNDTPKRELIAIDGHGTVYTCGAQWNDLERPLDTCIQSSTVRGAIRKLVRANGRLYAVGLGRRLYQREGTGRWSVFPGIPVPPDFANSAPQAHGFNDMAAFSPQDIYAVGGFGEVWHFDGSTWQQMPFPSEERLFTVACGGDGQVYITGERGSLWMGRKDLWQRVTEGRLRIRFRDAAWFAGRLWCGNEYGLWSLVGGKLVPLCDEQSPELSNCCGRIDLSVDGNLMLTASPHGAATFDGVKWTVLFNAAMFD